MDNWRKHSWQREMSVQRPKGPDKLGVFKEEKNSWTRKSNKERGWR